MPGLFWKHIETENYRNNFSQELEDYCQILLKFVRNAGQAAHP